VRRVIIVDVQQGPNPAAGNGVVDDTDAIQARIDEVAKHGGGVVFFPAGRYLVSNRANAVHCLELYSNVSLVGALKGRSPSATLVLAPWQPKDSRMVQAHRQTNLRIQTLGFDGQENRQRLHVVGGQIVATRTDNDVEHQAAVFLEGCTDVVIHGCEFSAAAADVIRARAVFEPGAWRNHTTRRLVIRECTFTNTRRVSVNFDGASDSEVRGCRFRSRWTPATLALLHNAIAMHQGAPLVDRASLITNEVDKTLDAPRPFIGHCFKMELDDAGGAPHVLTDVRFAENIVEDCGGLAVRSSTDLSAVARGLLVAGNTFRASDAYVGLIQAQGPALVFWPGHPVWVDGAEQVRIEGNAVSRVVPTGGLSVASCDDVQILRNRISDPLPDPAPASTEIEGLIQVSGGGGADANQHNARRRFGGRTTISGNVITGTTDCQRSGVTIRDTVGLRATDNVITRVGNGIVVYVAVHGVRVGGNQVGHCLRDGLVLWGALRAPANLPVSVEVPERAIINVSVVGNLFTQNRGADVAVRPDTPIQNVTVELNLFDRPVGASPTAFDEHGLKAGVKPPTAPGPAFVTRSMNRTRQGTSVVWDTASTASSSTPLPPLDPAPLGLGLAFDDMRGNHDLMD